MAKKQTWEELEQRVRDLEREIVERKRFEGALRQAERELRIKNRISEVFLTIPDEQMYAEVLQVILEALESEYGTFGYFNEDGGFVVPAMTRGIYWDKCNVPAKDIMFKRGKFGGIWGRALKEKKTLYSNRGPFCVPEGHIAIRNTMATPIIYRGKLVSAIHIANKTGDYDEGDKAFLETIADHIAPVLSARLQRDRQEKQRNQAREALLRLTQYLAKRVEELNCLYGISRLRENRRLSFEETLKGTVSLIPQAWQYSDIACARIVLQDQEFTTDNFRETDWKQLSDIVVNGERIGVLEVFYLEEKPEVDEGPFLKEERRLIDAIAERLGKITERKRAEDMLQEAHDELERRVEKRTAELRRLSSRLLEVQESERKRIAMELHDSVGQFLAATSFGVNDALGRMRQGAPETSVEALEALIPLIQQAGEEVRRIHTDLRPPLLDDLGVIATASWFCRECQKLYSGLRIETDFDVAEKEVPEPLKIVIFRILQEAVNNVAKHSKADLVRISLKGTNSSIELVIEDNGQGFDVAHVRSENKAATGVGLGSMKERTRLSDGAFSVDSIKGAGTTIRASWQF